MKYRYRLLSVAEARLRLGHDGRCSGRPGTLSFHASSVFMVVCSVLTAVFSLPAVASQPGRLPWGKSATDGQAKQAVQGGRELLELVGVDDSQLRALIDGQPLGDDDSETLVKIMYWLNRFSPSDLQQWAQNASWSEVVQEPDRFRGEVFQLQGRLQNLDRVDLHEDVARLYDFDHFFRLTVVPDSPQESTAYEFDLCVREVPQIWLTETPTGQNVSALGLFLKVGGEVEGRRQLILAAHRARWLPRETSPSLGVGSDHLRLAAAGFDVGLLDQARAHDRQPISSGDRECFLQLLTATPRVEVAESTPALTNVLDVLQKPSSFIGHRLVMDGRARRVTRVVVDLDEDRQRLGIDAYYQIDMFASLGDAEVELRDKNKQPIGAVFVSRYPVTICTATLPDELAAELGTQQFAQLDLPLRVDGYMMKMWSYRSQFVSGQGDQFRQAGPLLIGRKLTVLPDGPSAKNPIPGILSGVVFLGVLAGIWVAVWWFGRSDRKFQTETLDKQFTPEKNLGELDLDVQDGPDFSNLPK